MSLIQFYKHWPFQILKFIGVISLFQMVALDPTAPTPEEHSTKSVTKLRYMQFREQQSSSCSLGFRIEAMKVSSVNLSRLFFLLNFIKEMYMWYFYNLRLSCNCKCNVVELLPYCIVIQFCIIFHWFFFFNKWEPSKLFSKCSI